MNRFSGVLLTLGSGLLGVVLWVTLVVAGHSLSIMLRLGKDFASVAAFIVCVFAFAVSASVTALASPGRRMWPLSWLVLVAVGYALIGPMFPLVEGGTGLDAFRELAVGILGGATAIASFLLVRRWQSKRSPVDSSVGPRDLGA
jgi:uncharacterized membrane protein